VTTPEFLYKIILIEDGVTSAVIDWGNEPGWIDKYKAELERATRIWLVPKANGSPLRSVSVKLDNDKRWILFSRVYGKSDLGFGHLVRIYALGWQDTRDKINRKSMMWIYPSGEVEIAEEPSFGPLLLNIADGIIKSHSRSG